MSELVRCYFCHLVLFSHERSVLEFEVLLNRIIGPSFSGLDRTDQDYHVAAGIAALFDLPDCEDWQSRIGLLESTVSPDSIKGAILQVLVIGHLACRAGPVMRDRLILQLLDLISSNSYLLRQLIVEQIHRIARSAEMTSKTLLLSLLPDVSLLLIGNLEAQSLAVKEVAERLYGYNIKDFLERTLRYTLPQLVATRNESTLAQLAVLLKTEVAMLCVDHAHHILAKLFTVEEYDEAVEYFLGLVAPDGSISRFNLVKSCSLDLITALTFELGTRSELARPKVRAQNSTERTLLTSYRVVGYPRIGNRPGRASRTPGHEIASPGRWITLNLLCATFSGNPCLFKRPYTQPVALGDISIYSCPCPCQRGAIP